MFCTSHYYFPKCVRSAQYGCYGVSWCRVFHVCCSAIFWVILRMLPLSCYYWYQFIIIIIILLYVTISPTFSLPDTASKFHRVVTHTNLDLRSGAKTLFPCQICTYFYDLHIKFRMRGSNCSSFTATKPGAKYIRWSLYLRLYIL